MVSCENLLSESSELFGGVPESSGQHNLLSSSLKSSSNKSAGSNSSSSRKMYRSGGGIFSNPFKSDSEKMDLLTDLLKQYRESGIPETGGGGKHNHHLLHSQSHCQSTNKLNHLRASSLSIGGFTGSGSNQSAVSPTSAVANASNNSSANNSPSSSLLLGSSSSTHQKVTSLSTTDLHHLNHSLSLTGSPQSSAGQHQHQQQTSSSFDASDDAGSSYLYLEPEWGSIVEGAEQLPGRVKAQNEAIWELLTTEVFYIRRLKVVNDIFVACLLNLQSECILNEVGQLLLVFYFSLVVANNFLIFRSVNQRFYCITDKLILRSINLPLRLLCYCVVMAMAAGPTWPTVFLSLFLSISHYQTAAL